MGKKPEDPPYQNQPKKTILKARQMQEEASHYNIVTDNFVPIIILVDKTNIYLGCKESQ